MLARIELRQRDGWCVVEAVGELDLAVAPALRQVTRDALGASGGKPSVVVDLSRVDLLDSVSLGILLGVRRRIAEREGRLRVVVAAPAVERLFLLTDTAALFDLVPTLDAALQP